MSRTRIVNGKYTKISHGDHNMSAEGYINSNAMIEVRENGTQNGILHGNFERLGSDVNEDFEITFSLRKSKEYSTIVPFGILDFKGKYENAHFVFDYSLTLSNIDSLKFQIINEDNSILYSIENLPEIVVPSKKMPLLAESIIKGTPIPDPLKPKKVLDLNSIFNPYNVPPTDYTKIGNYVIFWDGFDNDDIYDSTKFNNTKLKARIIAKKSDKEKIKEIEFTTEYNEVDWVDVKIDKNNKRIDATLRVNLTDGGEEGLGYQTVPASSPYPATEYKPLYDWEKVSKEAIIYYKKEPIKTRTKSFQELRDLALKGINQFWSRNSSNIGQGININDTVFETFINAITDEDGMKAPEIIYFTNSEETNFTRSHNFELHRQLYYYEGYTYHSSWRSYGKNKVIYVTKGWIYKYEAKEILEFKDAAAHEIGHQLLFEYGKGGYNGRDYTYSHKNTSGPYWIQQDPLSGTEYPEKGEIDLMKYAEEERPVDYFERVVLSSQDSLGLLWLSKLSILSALTVAFILGSCQKNTIKSKNREIVDYYNGIVVDENKKLIKNVEVKMYTVNDENGTIVKNIKPLITYTNDKGYFRINDKSIDILHVQTETKMLFFNKKGYKLDSIPTNIGTSSYRPKYDDFEGLFFIFKTPDTVTLHKCTDEYRKLK